MKPLISVIVPVYNVEKYLHRCVDSILNQTFGDFELILVNDGSSDNSLAICQEYEKRDSRVTVIDTPNRGSSSARNTGLSKAVGNWVIHIDSDDWIELDMIQILFDKAIKEDADIVACGLIEDDGETCKLVHIYPYDKYEPKSEIFRVDVQYSSVCNKLVKKELYDKYNIHFVDGVRMWEDVVVTSRLRYHSRKTVIVNKPLYHYFCAPRQNMCSQDAGKFPVSQIRVVEFLTNYFNKISLTDPNLNKLLISLKLTAKKRLFSLNTEEEYNEWKDLYKEANKYILKMKHFPLDCRFKMFLAANISYRNISILHSCFKRLKKVFK